MKEYAAIISNILLCGVLDFQHWLQNTTQFWVICVTSFLFSLKLISYLSFQQNPKKNLYFFIGCGGFAISNILIIYQLFSVSYFFTFTLFYSLLIITGILQWMPPIVGQYHGAGGILRFFIHGIILPQLTSLVLLDQPSFSIILVMMPCHLSYQAYRIVEEIKGPNDPKSKHVSTAMLLGRHDSYRTFVMFHAFAWVFVLIDVCTVSFQKVLPLCLLPWVVSQINSMRGMKSGGQMEAFVYYQVFSLFVVLTNRDYNAQ